MEIFEKLFNDNENYQIGGNTIEKELPWITPGSIYRLDELICGIVPWNISNGKVVYDKKIWLNPRKKSDLKVLEFGAGGSTLFFSKRCEKVTTIEYNKVWINSIKQKLPNNVDIIHCENEQETVSYIKKLSDNFFDVLLVDNDWKIASRDELLRRSIPKLNKNRAIIILDNYGSPACFPESHGWSLEYFIENLLPRFDKKWIGEEYNSIWWGGLGTRIFHKGFFEKKIIEENSNRSGRWFKI